MFVKSRFRTIPMVVLAVLVLLQLAAAQVHEVQPFSADMQFSSTGAKAGHDMTGKMYVSSEHMRMDMQSGGPGGGAIMITNFASQTTDTLMPAQHMYMEFKADQQGRRGMGPNIKAFHDPNNPCADEPGSTCKNMGVEQVNGRTCDHWQITDKNGKVSNVWIDQKLHFPIKGVSDTSTWELTNIQEGEPAASLFEIPAGYQKMDVSGMMQGMHPPQQ
jgi:hypothetical protein